MHLIQAVSLAARLHAGQVDKLGEPYLGHLVRVMLRMGADAPEDEKIAALLHDSIEDVPGARGMLVEAGVPADIIDLVDALTRHPDETYEIYLTRLARTPKARWIKLADLEDNSDPDRLSRLPPDVAERLGNKYQFAREYMLATIGSVEVGDEDL